MYNGGGFETWIENIVEAANHDGMYIVDSTKNITLLSNEATGHVHDHGDEEADHDEHDHGDEEADHDEHDHGDEGADHDEHDHGEFDPHVWLDPNLAQLQAEAIKQALVELDPQHAEYYEENFANLVTKFEELDAQFKELSEHVERRDFIVSHAAFGYLAHRYDLNQISITGLSPTNEPSAKQLQEIIEFASENHIEYILFENLVTPKVAEVVKDAIGAESLVLHNLEGLTEEELSQGKDYFSLMQDNLDVLKQALGYK